MARLELTLFGPCQLTLDGAKIAQIESNKARGLLVFLAVEHHRPHARDGLADLLWPDSPIHAARSNFRRALANLRAAIGDLTANPPCLLITRETVQFNVASDANVDVVRFTHLVKTPETESAWVEKLEQAVALYRGPFLDGFDLKDCPEFEAWMTTTRGALEQLAAGALWRLAEHFAIQAESERALALYRRCLALEPYHEAAQRGLMRLLAAGDQRATALTHFAAFRRQLLDEFGAEPDAQTVALAESIRQGRSGAHETVAATGRTAVDGSRQTHGPATEQIVAGREEQLDALLASARRAERGHSCAVFVVGEAGSGKTFLLQAFARRLARNDRQWQIAFGACTALLGIGDPYQPFVDALRMLLANDLAHTPIDRAEVTRMLEEEAPDWARLILPGAARHAAARPAGQTAPFPVALHNTTRPGQFGQAASAAQGALFDQFSRLLDFLARRQPLLLALDNLHQADAGAFALLNHLMHHLNHSCILIVAAYRPGALALEQAEHRRSLDTAVHELQRTAAAVVIDLDQADGRRFVDALLDSAPNRFEDQFRDALCQHTEGHALFTVELLHTLRAAGALIQEPNGRWVANGVIDWATLPPHVEAVIGDRVARLAGSDRGLLNAASVAGDEFSAEFVAALLGIDERLAVERLSGDLCTTHRIVLPAVASNNTSAAVARYRFRHRIFRTYLYSALDQAQRVQLHRAAGLTLERLYLQPETAADVSLQELAWHFAHAGERSRALAYLRSGSQRALARCAYAEAVLCLTQAVAFAPPEENNLRFELVAAREQACALLRDQHARAQDIAELEQLAAASSDPRQQLVAALRRATLAEETTRYLEAVTAANAAQALAVGSHDLPAQIEAHLVAGRAHWWRGEIELAHRHYAYALRAARSLQPPVAVGACLVHLGIADWSLDDLTDAEDALREALKRATAAEDAFLRGAALMGLGMVACTQGEYAQADALLAAALALARQLNHPWLIGQVLLNQCALYRLAAEYARFFELHTRLLQHCQAIDDRWTAAAAQMEAATLFVQFGAWERARVAIEQAAVTADDLGALLIKARLLLLQARLALAVGEAMDGADVATQALAIARKLGVASLLAECWLVVGLVRQRQHLLTDAAAALVMARGAARGEAVKRLVPEIICAQVQLAWQLGDTNQALASIEELLSGIPHLLIEQAVDPSSLYMVCHTVLSAAGEPWAEQMIVRGSRLLHEHASLIPDQELRRSFCDDIEHHRALLTLSLRWPSSNERYP